MRNRFVKKTVSILAALFILLQTVSFVGPDTVQGASKELKDMQHHWAKYSVHFLAAYQVINGFEDGTFRPEGTVTREQFVTMLMKAKGYDWGGEVGQPVFSDVRTDRWSYSHIQTAVFSGAMVKEEYGEKFDPEANITRTEMVLMAARSLGLQEDMQSLTFKDADKIQQSNKGLVGATVKAGIITGFNDDTFRGNETATRAQAAVIITRVINYFPMHFAVIHSDYGKMADLLEKGYNPNTQDGMGFTPVNLAVIYNNSGIVKMLLEAGADVHIADRNGKTPMMHALENEESQALIDLLTDFGANMNDGSMPDDSAFTAAVLEGNRENVEKLIKAGADVNEGTGDSKITPLMVTVQNGNMEMMQLLMENGADPNLQTAEGITALIHAASSGEANVVKSLLDAGANPNLQTEAGGFALYNAVVLKDTEMAAMLLAVGADVNLRNEGGFTALHAAAYGGSAEMVQLLINAKADLNLQTDSGLTALHSAVAKNHADVVSLLIHAGADVNIEENNGITPLEIAEQKGYDEVAKLLRDAGATE